MYQNKKSFSWIKEKVQVFSSLNLTLLKCESLSERVILHVLRTDSVKGKWDVTFSKLEKSSLPFIIYIALLQRQTLQMEVVP